MTDKEFHAINLCVARCVLENGGTGELVDEVMRPLREMRSQLSALREALTLVQRMGAYGGCSESVRRVVTAALASTEPGGEEQENR